MSAVLGIDYSTKAIDLVVLGDDTDAGEHFRFPIEHKEGAFYAARNVRRVFPRRSWFEERGVWLVGIERPFGHPQTLTALMRVQGAIIAMIPPELAVIETPQSEWLRVFANPEKLPTTSAGRKILAQDRARDLGFRNSLMDANDAYGIAWAVRTLNEKAIATAAA